MVSSMYLHGKCQEAGECWPALLQCDGIHSLFLTFSTGWFLHAATRRAPSLHLYVLVENIFAALIFSEIAINNTDNHSITCIISFSTVDEFLF